MDRGPFQMPEQRLEQSGEEQMSRFAVFPGIELFQISFSAVQGSLEHEAFSSTLEINHCRRGQIGWDMQDGRTLCLGSGDLELHTAGCRMGGGIRLPLGYYEGISIALDLERLEREPLSFLEEAGIRLSAVLERLSLQERPLLLPDFPEIAHIFEPLYSVSERLRIPCYRLKVLELLLFLEQLASEPGQKKGLDRYESSQVERIKEIHDLLTEDLRRRYTIEELSRKYLINTATLKSVFKAVYGQPIGAYMKEYRLRRGMELLRQGDASIAEIAKQVGYESQGNFAEAFKAMTHISPTEYRRQYRESQL